ncbi:MAG: hypothetical protein IPM61_00375 [Chlorobi bacterium]|nr:hypothetical protein [Chlorobiota bacterium]
MMNASVKNVCRSTVLVVVLLCSLATASAQYTPHPRDFASHRFLMDDGTGNGFFGIIRLNGTLTNHIYYDFPVNASGSFIFSNSSGGQTIAGGLAVTGGLTADMLALSTPLAATSGGTGFSSYAVGDMLYANTTTSLARLPIGSNGLILTVSGGIPTWSNTASSLLLPFNQITNGTNTGQANLEVGNGSALYPVGTGAITANRFVTAASITDNVDLATSEVSGILPDPNVSNTLTITGGSIDGTPVGATTASTGRFTTITGTGLPSGSTSTVFTMSNSGALETRTAASLAGLIGVSTDATLTGDGTSGSPLGLNLANANTWTATQTFPTTAAQGDALIASTNSGSTTVNAVRIGNGLTNTQVNDDLTISGGTVDNSPVGATTASTGRFTTITGTTLPSGSTSTNIITSNGGALETRTAASLAGLIGVSTDATLTGDGTSGSPLGINLANANTWTATQTFPTTAAQGNALIASTNSGSSTVNAVRIGNGLTNTQVNDDLTISGGTVDNSPVGATTPSTGAFTTLDANGAVTLGNGNDNITLNAGSGVISASGDKIENVADPTAAQDAATKNYIDNTALGGVLGPFVQLGPAALQTYTGANPLIRLNETGASAPNLMDLRTAGTQHLVLTNGGALTVTNIEGTPIGATTRSTANVTDLDANGNVTLGNAAADVVTVNGTTTFANPVTANGAVTLGNGNDNITLNAGSGIISASGDKIENVADPTAAQDAATKNYVDNGFVRLGPTSAQTYTGANPLIRLDETGGSAPNLMDLRTAGTQHLVLTNGGALTVTNIEGTPIGATTRSTANVTDLDANGNVTLGNAAADVVTVNGTTTFANPVTANGAVTLGNGNDNITLNAGSGIISASGDKIENVADPTAAQDAATKNYVDNGFVRLGPTSAQTYTGANPLIRLDETGGSAPNLMDLRTAGTQHLLLTNAGALTATSIQATPIGTTTRSLANVTDLDANGDVTLGNAAADAVTVNGTTTFANPVTANGAVTLGNGNDNITLNAGSGVISASGDKIENVADPTAAQDAATKNYIDNTVLGE